MRTALGSGRAASIATAPLRVGTRGSALALWQARLVAGMLESDGISTQLVEIETRGDADLATPIEALGSAAPFADEIETALLASEIDLAVHSYKDLAASDRDGLAIAAVLERGDAREAVVSRGNVGLARLPRGAVVGTCSTRRAAQIAYLYPHLSTKPLRGTVPDRLRQLHDGHYDAILLAAAGLQRLGLEREIAEYLALDRFVPAPAQAALAIQVRSDNVELRASLERLEDRPSRTAVELERAILARYESQEGHVVAAYATAANAIEFHVRILTASGRPIFDGVFAGARAEFVFRRAVERVDAAIAAFERAGRR